MHRYFYSYLNFKILTFTEDQNVKSARNKFKNVLKHMVQDNFLQDEESDSENDENRL